jgi:2-desacetyl-2-hydroxyethyl bacteriochlorophyllide A dehydrogenase
MRAFTITAPNHAEVRDLPAPVPGPGEAIVKVAFCGICGTDYHIFKGDFLSPYPLTNGHEFSGVISAIGPNARGWREGDRVAVDPSIFCGECYHCLRRQWNQCDDWGAIGDTTAGAFAEYVRVPTRNMYRVEDHETLEEAAFTEPLACVVWGVERLAVTPGERVLIFGAGPIGGLLTQCLAKSPTADVVVVDVMEEKLAVVRTMGATATYVSGPDLPALLTERTKGRLFDVVLDCTGIAPVIEGMFQYAAPRAKIMFFGVASPKDTVRINPFDVYHKDWQIIGSMAINYTFQQARDLLAAGRIDVKPLLTRIASLDDMAGILGRPKTPTELKTLVRPSTD